ncbi:MAG: PorP/SprF family type IX secretion system membrane protein [Sediminibacterium sp.]
MQKLILFCCLVMLLGTATAQDPHFSQFFSSPLTLNPANIGKFDGSIRVAGNYKNQWQVIDKAYETKTVSVDFHILNKYIASEDTWGVGLMGYTDKSANGAISFNYATVGTSFHKGLDEEGTSQIGAGFQLSYANMLINTAELHFEDQLTSNGFTNVSSEAFSGATLKSNYFDLNAGLLYSGSSSDKNYFYFGASAYHLNRPKQEFTGALYLLEPRVTVHSGGYFPLGESGKLHVSGLYSTQGSATEMLIGGAFERVIDPELNTSIYAGGWIRFNDALIPYLGIEIGDLRIGATYDINTSSLKAGTYMRGGLEMSLIYQRRPSNSKTIRCPKF